MIILDITHYKNILDTFSRLFDIDKKELVNYILKNNNNRVIDFLKYFNINIEKMIKGQDVYLASLHVTTSNDSCKYIRENGLLNLQETLKRETPLNLFLKSNDIEINLEKKTILYKDSMLDISKEYNGISHDEDEAKKDYVINRLFHNFEIDSFLIFTDEIEDYNSIEYSPEILITLSNLLNIDLRYEWLNQKKFDKYIVKFKSEIGNFNKNTFKLKRNEDSIYLRIYSILEFALEALHVKINGDITMEDFIAEMNDDVQIEAQDIMDIYLREEFIKNNMHLKI